MVEPLPIEVDVLVVGAGQAGLVVGGGNSAAQLAIELAATHEVTVAVPGPPWYLPVSLLGVDMYWWSYLTGVLNADRDSRASRYLRRRGDAIVGRQLRKLVRAGHVRLLPHRVVGAAGRTVELADGSRLQVSSGCGAAASGRTPRGSTSPRRSTGRALRCTPTGPLPSPGCTGWACRGRPG